MPLRGGGKQLTLKLVLRISVITPSAPTVFKAPILIVLLIVLLILFLIIILLVFDAPFLLLILLVFDVVSERIPKNFCDHLCAAVNRYLDGKEDPTAQTGREEPRRGPNAMSDPDRKTPSCSFTARRTVILWLRHDLLEHYRDYLRRMVAARLKRRCVPQTSIMDSESADRSGLVPTASAH